MHFHSIYIHVNYILFPFFHCLNAYMYNKLHNAMNSRVSCFIQKIRPPGNNWTSQSYMHTYINTLLREDILCTIQALAFKGTICNQIVPSTYMTARRWWRFCWGCLRFWWRSRCRCCGRGSTVSHWS